jgi:hypothetical protein
MPFGVPERPRRSSSLQGYRYHQAGVIVGLLAWNGVFGSELRCGGRESRALLTCEGKLGGRGR